MAPARFYTPWIDVQLSGSWAMKGLDSAHRELKSLRTVEAFRGRDVGHAMPNNLLAIKGQNRVASPI